MPRSGGGVYTLPAGSVIANGDVSDAADLNTPLADIEADMNTPRPVVAGGTGADNAADARTNLGLSAVATRTITAGGGVNVTNGDGVSGDPVIDAIISRGTSVSASGTAVDFTGIPSWARRITVCLDGVSLSGTNNVTLQIGDSGGVETTGYVAGAAMGPSANENVTATGSFPLGVPLNSTAADAKYGVVTLVNPSGNLWLLSGVIHSSSYAVGNFCAGSKTLSGTLDRVRILSSGADTFDGGTINIFWE